MSIDSLTWCQHQVTFTVTLQCLKNQQGWDAWVEAGSSSSDSLWCHRDITKLMENRNSARRETRTILGIKREETWKLKIMEKLKGNLEKRTKQSVMLTPAAGREGWLHKPPKEKSRVIASCKFSVGIYCESDFSCSYVKEIHCSEFSACNIFRCYDWKLF